MALPLSLLSAVCICVFVTSAAKDEKPMRDCGGQHVCTTLMRYKDGTTVDEGQYCECKESNTFCSKEWDGNDDARLTWQHYERAHWTVQYRFCTPVFRDKNVCRPGEVAAIVETDVKTWEPYVSNPRCVCASDVAFKMMGWKKEGGVWKYYYQCEKEECPAPAQTLKNESICAKMYVDTSKSTDKVIEVQFLCNCPEGYLCPAKFDDKTDNKKIERDEHGSYVPKMCETILQQKR